MVLNPVIEMVSTHPPGSKDPKGTEKDMKCWGCGVQDIVGESVPHPDRGINLPFKLLTKIRTKIMGKI